MKQPQYKALFFGTPDFCEPSLQALLRMPEIELVAIFTQPDKPVGRRQILTPPPVKVCAIKNGVQIFQPRKINTEKFKQQLKEIAPDVCMVIAYGKIIPSGILAIPKHGWLNMHASLLPKYRGASPIQAAILNGDEKTGVTLMQINAGLDTGPIISQKTVPIADNETSPTLHDKLATTGAELLQESLLDYLEGNRKPQVQDETKVTLTKIINKEDGRIDWSSSAENIKRQIRAYTPWPGVFCFWNNLRLKIIEASVAEEIVNLSPGQTKLSAESIIVGCGQGNLELKKIQLEGKVPQPISEFLKGHPEFSQTQLS